MARKRKTPPAAVIDDGLGNQRLNERGEEMLDQTPMAIPTGLSRAQTLAEKVAMMVRSERFNEAMRAAGAETFEEADDFDVGDDFDPTSPWENDYHLPLDEERRLMAQSAQEALALRPAPQSSPAAAAADPQPLPEGGARP